MERDIRTLIAFSMVKNINSSLANNLLDRIGDEKVFFSLSDEELAAIGRIPKQVISNEYRRELLNKAATEERFIIANNIETLYFTESTYPSRLINCEDAPVMLYRLGDTDLESRHIISIVGTRHATPHGIETTNRIVKDLAQKLDNLVIISGLAYGIDVAAHKAALENNIPTVAVSAVPLNSIYPADHRGIAVNILKAGGSIITEYSTSHDVHRANFLARNRIIAGLADVTIVVESDVKGGSLVTASLAMEYNREVFAVPGRLTDKYSGGTNRMIASHHARIYVDADDLINEMGWESKESEGDQKEFALELTPVETQIHEYLMAHPASKANDIMLATGIPIGQLKDLLFTMEMKDLVMSMAGGKYSAL